MKKLNASCLTDTIKRIKKKKERKKKKSEQPGFVFSHVDYLTSELNPDDIDKTGVTPSALSSCSFHSYSLY